MRRFAVVVIVEADSGPEAFEHMAVNLAEQPSGPEPVCYIGEPCPVGPADEYETEGIHLIADGELAFAAPPPVHP